MARCIAEPLSRKDIRKTAELIRKIDGSENDMFFDIVRLNITVRRSRQSGVARATCPD